LTAVLSSLSRFRPYALVAVLMCSPGVVLGDPPAAGMQRLQAFLREVDSFQAGFRQAVLDADQQLLEQASGQVVLKRPGRFRWDYRQPYERVIVADGERVWMYEVDLAQVTVRPLGSSLGATPAALLSGDPEALERFDYLGDHRDGDILWVRLRPKSAAADFESIDLGFTAAGLVRLDLHDRLGQSTQLEFEHIELNGEVSDELFHLEVPDGVDVIGDGSD